MKRRNFLGLVGRAAIASFGASAQPSAKPTIGLLGTPAAPIGKPYAAAFVQRLPESRLDRGSHRGGRVSVGGGRNDRFDEIAADFVRLKVDVILTSGAAVKAVKKATSTIPIVFAIGTDPVGSGHVVSLARPGGNVTGPSLQAADASGKRLELLRESFLVCAIWLSSPTSPIRHLPRRWRMSRQWPARSVAKSPSSKSVVRRRSNQPFLPLKLRPKRSTFVGMIRSLTAITVLIPRLAAAAGVPTVSGDQAYVNAGGLISYGPNFSDMFRRSADYVDKILRGVKPEEIPVEQPTKFDLIINLETAKAFKLQVPAMFLALADEVIE